MGRVGRYAFDVGKSGHAGRCSGRSGVEIERRGAGNYRVAYDEASWKLLLATLPGMNVPDQVNLLSDAWAFVQEGRKPLSFYTDLIDRLPASTALAVREQIINAFNSIDHLLAGTAEQETFRRYARGVLRPTLDALGLQPKAEEPVTASLLRASLVQQLGLFGDEDVIKTCRQNFDNYLKNPESIPPDLRAPIFAIVMRYGDVTIWQKLHELGLKTASTEDKQYYYDALAFATDPKLIQKSLAITLTDELPTSRATFMVPKVARERPPRSGLGIREEESETIGGESRCAQCQQLSAVCLVSSSIQLASRN
jgi:aminopeptidase N